MTRLQIWATSAAAAIVLVSPAFAPSGAFAHTGGPLDEHGCHADRRRGNYHCHQGELQGLRFRSKSDLEEALRTGNLPEKPEPKKGLLDRLWSGRDDDEEKAAETTAAPPAAGGAASQAAPQAPAGPARSFEERLKILAGLYELGLITKEEYDARRKAILEEL